MLDSVTQLRSGPLPGELHKRFADLGDWPFAGRLSEILTVPHQGGPAHRRLLLPSTAQRIGANFHKMAGTLTPRVANALDQIGTGDQSIRVAHQPNFAGSMKLLGLFILAEEASASTGRPNVFISNDCDTINNDRFRRTKLPDLTRKEGTRYLGVQLRGIPSATVAFRAPRPPESWLHAMSDTVLRNLEDEFVFTGRTRETQRERMQNVLEDLHSSWTASESLSEMTSVFLSRLVNLRLELSTVFIPGHSAWMEAGVNFSTDLIDRWDEVQRAQEAVYEQLGGAIPFNFNSAWLTERRLAPFWSVCACGCRVRLAFRRKNSLGGTCEHCGTPALLSPAQVGDWIGAGNLIPRVGLLDLAENSAEDFAVGISYMTSGSHALVYALVGERLGIASLPQAFISLRGDFNTPLEQVEDRSTRMTDRARLTAARTLVREGRAASVYYMTRRDPQNLVAEISGWARSHEFDDDVGEDL